MTRKNIFEILENKWNIIDEIKRIYKLLNTECINVRYSGNKTVIEFIDDYCFYDWKNRHCYLNISDMADDLDIELDDDIGFMLNNIHIRHNNKSGKSKKEYVSKTRKATMEKWYDETYQMLLLAFLLNEQPNRSKKINQLKEKIR